MDLDTGAAVSIMTLKDLERFGLKETLVPTKVGLQTYSRELLKLVGCSNVMVSYGGETRLRLFVLHNGGPLLFGREWILAQGMPQVHL